MTEVVGGDSSLIAYEAARRRNQVLGTPFDKAEREIKSKLRVLPRGGGGAGTAHSQGCLPRPASQVRGKRSLGKQPGRHCGNFGLWGGGWGKRLEPDKPIRRKSRCSRHWGRASHQSLGHSHWPSDYGFLTGTTSRLKLENRGFILALWVDSSWVAKGRRRAETAGCGVRWVSGWLLRSPKP